MGYIEGLLGGFTGRKSEVEKENIRQSELASQRETAILSHLMTSDDPEIRSAAVTGLLDSASPKKRKGGLAGWMGEMQANPSFGRIRTLMNTPVQDTQPGLPSRQTQGGMATPPGLEGGLGGGIVSREDGIRIGDAIQREKAGQSATPQTQIANPQEAAAQEPSAAMPAQSPVTGGPPPAPTVLSTTVSPSQPIPMGPPHPRQAFLSPEQKYAAQARGKAQGDVEGEKAGLLAAGVPDAQATEVIRQRMLRQGRGSLAASRIVKGPIIPDEASETGFSQLMLDPQTGVESDRIPAMDPVKARASEHFFGIEAEKVSKEPAFGGVSYAQQTPEGAAKVNAEVARRIPALAGQRAAAVGDANNATKMNAPLNPANAAAQAVPFGTSMKDLAGITPLTPTQRARHDAAANLAPQIDEIASLVKTVFPPQSGLGGGLKASIVLAKKRAARDPDMARLDGAIQRAVGNVARVLNAESGRLTQQDVQRAQKTLADLSGYTDTQESALAKLADVDATLQKIAQDIQTPGEVLRGRQGGTGAPPAPSGTPTKDTVAAGQAYQENGVWKIKK